MPRICSQSGYHKGPWSSPLNQVTTSSVPGRGAILMPGNSHSRTQASQPSPTAGVGLPVSLPGSAQ